MYGTDEDVNEALDSSTDKNPSAYDSEDTLAYIPSLAESIVYHNNSGPGTNEFFSNNYNARKEERKQKNSNKKKGSKGKNKGGNTGGRKEARREQSVSIDSDFKDFMHSKLGLDQNQTVLAVNGTISVVNYTSSGIDNSVAPRPSKEPEVEVQQVTIEPTTRLATSSLEPTGRTNEQLSSTSEHKGHTVVEKSSSRVPVTATNSSRSQLNETQVPPKGCTIILLCHLAWFRGLAL